VKRNTSKKQGAENGNMTKAGEFNGDLRDLPKTPVKATGTAPVREPRNKPKPAPTATPNK